MATGDTANKFGPCCNRRVRVHARRGGTVPEPQHGIGAPRHHKAVVGATAEAANAASLASAANAFLFLVAWVVVDDCAVDYVVKDAD